MNPDVLFSSLANTLGASVDQIKILSCLLIAYPLGSLFIRIPSSRPNLKHAFNILVSLFFLMPVLGLYWGVIHLLGSILATYVIAASIRGSRMPWIVFAVVMGHLIVNYVIHVVYGISVDIAIPQMALSTKLTSFAWNVHDGRKSEEDLDRWQVQKRVTKYPTLLEFLGFSFYFPGVLIGPPLDHASYVSLIDESLFKSTELTKPMRRAIPGGRKRVAYRKLLTGLVFMGFFAALIPSHSFTTALTPWFAKQSLLYRITLFQFYGFVERCKFYTVWSLSEGASILTGLGFSGIGPSGESHWEGATNVKILEVELPSNFKVLLDSWNINTNVWLREYVYKRVTPKGRKPGFRSTLITCFTSASWHGIAIGYYLTFIPGGFVTYLGRECRACLRPLVTPSPGAPFTWAKRTYDFLGTLICILLLNFVTAPFRLLTLANTIEAWSRLGWYGWWIMGFGVFFFNAGGSAYLQRLQQEYDNHHVGDVGRSHSLSPGVTSELAVEDKKEPGQPVGQHLHT